MEESKAGENIYDEVFPGLVQVTKTPGLRPFEKKDTPIVFRMLNEVSVTVYACTWFINENENNVGDVHCTCV